MSTTASIKLQLQHHGSKTSAKEEKNIEYVFVWTDIEIIVVFFSSAILRQIM